ncbi:MAG: hypothetical protein KF730_10720 [Sphingomonas sp.]|uniref:hypothetical protein n=1 Tax=Sphingomonas sp. TaxID=28214 RepID=UPI0025FC3FF9|nr:hypothetical protein [Sphingomonas sp.]MBX3565035.1 hypothetical protein [Sphingomonas sp.]
MHGAIQAVRTFVALLAAVAMALAPIPAQAEAPRISALAYGPLSHSEFSLVPRDLDALARRLAPPPPMAMGNTLWEKLKGLLKDVLPNDVIQLAQFSILHPVEAESVYSHAASQDYPFFALIGAAKLARKLDPKHFTYDICTFPVASLDSVWGKADTTISNAGGKQDTNFVINAAKEYAKQSVGEAKNEVNAQLAETIPYFGEIPTICLFAFETDLNLDKDIQNAVSSASQDLRELYDDISNGDVVEAVKDMATLGLNSQFACKLINTMLTDGLIGKVPGLSELASGVCSTFMKVLVAIARAVVELASDLGSWAYQTGHDVVCGGAALIGYHCDTPPPPNAVNKGLDFCAAHGGINYMTYRVDKRPDTFFAMCKDGWSLQRNPGVPDQVISASQYKEMRDKIAAETKAWLQKRIDEMKGDDVRLYRPMCPPGDAQCQSELNLLLTKVTNQIWAAYMKNKLDYPSKLLGQSEWGTYGQQAYKIANDASFRVLPDRWRPSFIAFWSERCEDEKCRTAMKIVGLGIGLAVRQQHARQPKLTYAQVSVPLYGEALRNATGLIAESQARSAAFNKKTTHDASEGWEQLAVAKWSKQCLDQPCIDEVTQLAGKMKVAARLLQQAQPDRSALAVQGEVSREYGPKFQAAIDASLARNRAKTKDASSEWEQWLIDQWSPKCADAQCQTEVRTLAGKAKVAMRLYQMGKPNEPAGRVQLEVLKEYRPQFDQAVSASLVRRNSRIRPIGRTQPAPGPTPGPVRRLPPRPQ